VVTALGATTDAQGNLLVTVGLASEGDNVLGIVSAAVEGVQSGSEDAPRTVFKDSGSQVAAGGTLRIITGGIVTVAAADATGGPIAAGDPLTLSASAGKLAKAQAGGASSVHVGIALGTLADGTVVLFLD